MQLIILVIFGVLAYLLPLIFGIHSLEAPVVLLQEILVHSSGMPIMTALEM